MTLFPMLHLNNVSTNTFSILFATIFGLVFYFIVIKGLLLMVYMLPQSFPDEVLRIISAGIGDLGQSKAMGAMEGGEGTARAAQQTLDGAGQASNEQFRGTMKSKQDKLAQATGEADKKADEKRWQDLIAGVTGNRNEISGAGGPGGRN